MKIKTSSWHYRLWKFGRENWRSEPKNLCQYFWHLALIKILFPLAAVLMALAGIVSLAIWIWGNPMTTALIIAGAAVAVGLVVAMVLGIRKLVEKQDAKEGARRAGEIPEKEPGVTRQFLAARKRKLCPLIEVVREKEVFVDD